MAKTTAITAVSQALVKLLQDAAPQSTPPPQFALYQPGNFETPMEAGISVFLYDCQVEPGARNLPLPRDPSGQRPRPPLALTLRYIITPWAQDAAQQQRWLGWLRRTLYDHPVLTAAFLNQAAGTEVFAAPESVRVEDDDQALALMDRLRLLHKLNPRTPPSVMVRVIGLQL